MSGYWPYVWSCFGLTCAVLIYNVWAARRQWAEQLVKAKRRVAVGAGAEA
ncbi:MAG: heme exporter protein CcmD [Xanthomonadaceae bacterium]|nr:heme exporter protein CcmD [Xanthomonadaceae bacterium]